MLYLAMASEASRIWNPTPKFHTDEEDADTLAALQHVRLRANQRKSKYLVPAKTRERRNVEFDFQTRAEGRG